MDRCAWVVESSSLYESADKKKTHLCELTDREIWLQKPAEGAEPVFAAYDLAGRSLGDVRIAGLEGGVEHMVLHEELLLTFAECEDGTGAIARQTFRLYRLGI